MQLSTVADPFGIWGRAAGAARRGAGAALDRSEIAAIEGLGRAGASARAEEALDIVLRSPLADRAVRSIVDGPLLDVAVRTAVERGVVERLVDEIMAPPLPHPVTDQRLASDELWHVGDEIARTPSVPSPITQESAGFADQV